MYIYFTIIILAFFSLPGSEKTKNHEKMLWHLSEWTQAGQRSLGVDVNVDAGNKSGRGGSPRQHQRDFFFQQVAGQLELQIADLASSDLGYLTESAFLQGQIFRPKDETLGSSLSSVCFVAWKRLIYTTSTRYSCRIFIFFFSDFFFQPTDASGIFKSTGWVSQFSPKTYHCMKWRKLWKDVTQWYNL